MLRYINVSRLDSPQNYTRVRIYCRSAVIEPDESSVRFPTEPVLERQCVISLHVIHCLGENAKDLRVALLNLSTLLEAHVAHQRRTQQIANHQ